MLFEEFINELLILIMRKIRRLLTCDVSVLLCNDEGLIKGIITNKRSYVTQTVTPIVSRLEDSQGNRISI